MNDPPINDLDKIYQAVLENRERLKEISRLLRLSLSFTPQSDRTEREIRDAQSK